MAHKNGIRTIKPTCPPAPGNTLVVESVGHQDRKKIDIPFQLWNMNWIEPFYGYHEMKIEFLFSVMEYWSRYNVTHAKT
jgi:hypothetical protein